MFAFSHSPPGRPERLDVNLINFFIFSTNPGHLQYPLKNVGRMCPFSPLFLQKPAEMANGSVFLENSPKIACARAVLAFAREECM
jgi:hypothetical protein